MTHKHELQDVIFNMNDSLSNLTVISTDITHVIIQLELAASKVQSMTVCLLSAYSYSAIALSFCYDLFTVEASQ